MRKTESLDQVCPSGAYVPTWTSKLQNKSEFRGSILEELINFATSVPDFRRSNKGNIRHRLADIIMLMILGRASGNVVRTHWSIESMHWGLDVNLQQDRIKRRSSRAARNLDTIHRIVHSIFSIWKRLRKKRADRRKGMAEIMRLVSANFTKLIRFLYQK